jgi:hypothetical protein
MTIDVTGNDEYELTQKHYEMFKDEFMHWVDVFGLRDWELAFYFTDTGKDNEDERVRACIQMEFEGRLAMVTLDAKWTAMQPDDYNIRRCAYHEAVELLLGKVMDLARRRSITAEQLESETHAVIRILENTHFEQDYSLRKPPVKKRIVKKK